VNSNFCASRADRVLVERNQSCCENHPNSIVWKFVTVPRESTEVLAEDRWFRAASPDLDDFRHDWEHPPSLLGDIPLFGESSLLERMEGSRVNAEQYDTPFDSEHLEDDLGSISDDTSDDQRPISLPTSLHNLAVQGNCAKARKVSVNPMSPRKRKRTTVGHQIEISSERDIEQSSERTPAKRVSCP